MSEKSTIFVVGGHYQNINELENMVNSHYNLIFMSNKTEALQLYKEISHKVKCILFFLSNDDDETFISSLKTLNRIPEILIISEQNDHQKAIQLMKQGAFDFILQPFTKEILLHHIQQVTEEVDLILKIEKISRAIVLDTIEKRMQLLIELIQKRRKEGLPLNSDEISALFSQSSLDSESSALIPSLEQNQETSSILVVDDEQSINQTIKQILMRKGYKTACAGSVSEAQELAKIQFFHVALLDIGLPDQSGLKLLQHLKATSPTTEVVMLTAYTDTQNIVEAFQMGAFDYLVKPFEIHDLLSTVVKALQRHQLKQLIPNHSKHFIGATFSEKFRMKLLDEIAHERLLQGKQLLMQDVCILFPDLKQKGFPETKVISKKKIEDGLGLLIDELRQT